MVIKYIFVLFVKQVVVNALELCYALISKIGRSDTMAKRIVRRWDEERTELLDQSELFVQKGKGSEYYYYAWLQEPEVETCPLCSGKAIKMQDLFSKTYQELIRAKTTARLLLPWNMAFISFVV